jgi:hypothetical protein
MKMNDDERRDWINNVEWLYTKWISSRLSMRVFIRENREMIDTAINFLLNLKPRA